MIQSFLKKILVDVVLELATWAYQKVKRWLSSRERNRKTHEAAKKVEEASNETDIIDSANNLP